ASILGLDHDVFELAEIFPLGTEDACPDERLRGQRGRAGGCGDSHETSLKKAPNCDPRERGIPTRAVSLCERPGRRSCEYTPTLLPGLDRINLPRIQETRRRASRREKHESNIDGSPARCPCVRSNPSSCRPDAQVHPALAAEDDARSAGL